jgi:SAM-dependent methyltransferase
VEASTLLEVGAGTGQDSVFFRDAGLDVVAVDLSPEMVRRCTEKGIKALVRDVAHLEMPPGSFDAVWAMNCLLHVPDTDLPAVLREIRTVLRPGGLFYVGLWGDDPAEGAPAGLLSFRGDEQVFAAVHEMFEVIDFHTIEDEGHHFQALTAVRPLD